ncbi:MAG: hypothetical protein A2918_03575 [Candidatus Yanofskybacteria bacterium RIFCSPLOWO2_01_FULL_42_49]|uniref:Uncharacterized protein n=1 Tax=Candidatus Yanofskybacteria bacterium RIFCSPLOWO2_01_FULL_42_49 TaxID=1802694 RepID=A0A1F8GDG1_9BACT|nr:MAG: hypothetical protein A2918_03575 [Candidatus Yanofskybacteria bacterium RIFCSPLOWO2_01_FULL_42_49]
MPPRLKFVRISVNPIPPKKNLKLSDSELRFRFSNQFFRVLATAAEGGEMGSDYLQDTHILELK